MLDDFKYIFNYLSIPFGLTVTNMKFMRGQEHFLLYYNERGIFLFGDSCPTLLDNIYDNYHYD